MVCGPWHEEWSYGRYQFAEVSLCTKEESGKIAFKIAAKEIQYYWGAAWYYAKKASLQGTVTLAIDGQGGIKNTSYKGNSIRARVAKR